VGIARVSPSYYAHVYHNSMLLWWILDRAPVPLVQ